jgi:hypothetical protein
MNAGFNVAGVEGAAYEKNVLKFNKLWNHYFYGCDQATLFNN